MQNATNDGAGRPVSVSTTIAAPADRIFAILTRPADHPKIDGSGMLRGSPGPAVTGVGDVFNMAMHNEEFGDNEMENHVVAFEADRIIGWEPVLKAASGTDAEADIGVHNGVRWAYELQPVDERTTRVTETYDCTTSPEWLRRAVKNGERWVDSMTATLANLKALAET